jgi:hypothetical protein
MKKVLWSALVVALLLTLLISGSSCGKTASVTATPTPTLTVTPVPTITSTPSQSSADVLVKSPDGSVSLSVPSDWNTNDTSLYPGSIIGVANSTNDEYVIVTKKSKSGYGSGSTINDYMTTVKNVFAAILTNPIWGQTSSVTIGGCNGLTTQVTGTRTRDNANLTYFINALESKNYYYNVCGWTITSAADANKPAIENIIKSFKETD